MHIYGDFDPKFIKNTRSKIKRNVNIEWISNLAFSIKFILGYQMGNHYIYIYLNYTVNNFCKNTEKKWDTL